MNFFVPPHMEKNFEDFLATEICKDVAYCKDYFEAPQKWVDERAEITPINYKSKQYGSDNNVKIRFRKSCAIQKGDMIRYGGKYYLATWRTHHVTPDSLPTNMELCNVIATIKRENAGELDPETGAYKTMPGGFNKVVEDLPAIFMVNGNYELRHKNSQVGLLTDNRTKLTVQANSETLKVKRGDFFEYYDDIYIIRDINTTELDGDGRGLLIWNFGLTANEEALHD